MKKHTITVTYEQEETPLVDVVSSSLKISKKQAKKLLDSKMVYINGRRIWMAKHLVKEDDEIEVHVEEVPQKLPKRLPILWQDENYLIINKPPFMLTNADPASAEAMLQKQENNREICAVHRLDKETSGCIIFAKSAKAKAEAIPLFREKAIMKIYRALTTDKFPSNWKEIRTDIDGLISTTLVKVLDSNRRASYLELRIETGRTHQIRRHLADRRYPVLGDKKYAGTRNELSTKQPRQMLHAHRLIFNHPTTKETIRVTAPLPHDFQACLKELKLK